MMVLLQLIKLLEGNEQELDGLFSWCECIEQDHDEIYELDYTLRDHGIELSETQLSSLARVCSTRSKYEAAFKISEVA